MNYENNDKVFTVRKDGKMCFGRVKLSREKMTALPSNSDKSRLFQVIWDDYREVWQWLESIETPLIIYDREFEIGDRVIYGQGLKGTIRKVNETAILLTDAGTVIENVKIKDIEYLTTIYPSAMIEYEGWTGEVNKVIREILCQCEDGQTFSFQKDEALVPPPSKNKKKGEECISRIAKIRMYPFHQENIKYFPGSGTEFSKKELKGFNWLNSDGNTIKPFKQYKKYAMKPVTVKHIKIVKVEAFWSGHIPSLLVNKENADKPGQDILESDLEKIHPLKPKELSSSDCKDFINFGYGSYFQYFPKGSDNQIILENWEFKFKSKFGLSPSENENDNLDCNRNEVQDQGIGTSNHKKSNKPIRVEKILSTRCYEVKYWGEEKAGVILPGRKIQSDERYFKVSQFKMGYPFVTKRYILPDYGKLGIIIQKSVPDMDELKSTGVVWVKSRPDGSFVMLKHSKESPYDLSYVAPPCLTMVGSILYNPEENDTSFKYGIITQMDLLDFGRVHLYDPIRGHSVKDINQLRAVHRQDSRRNCLFWTCGHIFKHDIGVDIGTHTFLSQKLKGLTLKLANTSDFDVDAWGTEKYSELLVAPKKHMFYSQEDIYEDNDKDKLVKAKWEARVELEKKNLATNLPYGIWVCGFKDRNDLLSVAIEGNAGSILEDNLILLEMRISSSFPKRSIMDKVPYSLYFSTLEGAHACARKSVSEYYTNVPCNLSPTFVSDWNVLNQWDARNSTLIDVLTTIKAKLPEHILKKRISDPGRMELNYNGLQTEYVICQRFNFALSMEILDNILANINSYDSAPWIYVMRRYYSQATIRIINRYEKWMSMDNTHLQENSIWKSKDLPNYPLLPFSKDFSSSIMDRLVFLREILVDGKTSFSTTLRIASEVSTPTVLLDTLKDFAQGFLEYLDKNSDI